MHAKLYQLLFGVKFIGSVALVENILETSPAVHLVVLEQGRYGSEIAHVSGHISGQDDANHSLSERALIVRIELLHEVVFVPTQDRHTLSRVIILLHT